MFGIAAGCAVLALAIAIVIDIVGRRFFGFSLQGTDEYGGYTLATIGSLGLASALFARGHTRIDIFLPKLPTGQQALANFAAFFTLAIYAAFIAWYAVSALRETLEFDARANSPLQTPLWIPQAIWSIGSAFFLLATLYLCAQGLRLAARDPTEMNRQFGPLTTAQEVSALADELKGDAVADQEKRA